MDKREKNPNSFAQPMDAPVTRAELQDLYRRINQEGHTEVAVDCPSCGQSFTVDVAGDAVGES